MTQTVEYAETGFLIDSARNSHTLHQRIHDLLFEGKNSPDGRTFLYSVVEAPELDGKCLVNVRTYGQVSPNIPLEAKESAFSKGQALELNVDISLQRSTARGKDGKKVPQASMHVRPYEMEDWMREKMRAIGFDADRITWGPVRRRQVSKPSAKFFIPCAVFRVTGTVNDPERFAQAWLYGVGRNKGYGLGLLEEVAA